MLEVLRLLAEGRGLRAVCRTKGVTPDAVGAWLLKASKHVKEVTVYLEKDMHLTQGQIDEFWSYILKKSPAQRGRKHPRGPGRSMDVCQRAPSQWVHSNRASWETDEGRGRAIWRGCGFYRDAGIVPAGLVSFRSASRHFRAELSHSAAARLKTL